MISQHIRPKWGDSNLKEVRPTLVQDWLRKLDVSPKYKGHIRSLLYRLFDKAMLWELLDVERNPMELVVQQKLMRHAHVSTTMDQYGNASALAKRKANRPIVQRLLRRSGNHQVSVQ